MKYNGQGIVETVHLTQSQRHSTSYRYEGYSEFLGGGVTHVVQQNGSALGRKLLPEQEIKKTISKPKLFLTPLLGINQ